MGRSKDKTETCWRSLGFLKPKRRLSGPRCENFLTAYRTTPHSSAGATPDKILFNREIRSKILELGNLRYADSETRDKDAEMKQERTDYADGKKGWSRNCHLEPGDLVLLKQEKNHLWWAEGQFTEHFNKTRVRSVLNRSCYVSLMLRTSFLGKGCCSVCRYMLIGRQ